MSKPDAPMKRKRQKVLLDEDEQMDTVLFKVQRAPAQVLYSTRIIDSVKSALDEISNGQRVTM